MSPAVLSLACLGLALGASAFASVATTRGFRPRFHPEQGEGAAASGRAQRAPDTGSEHAS